MQHSSIHSIRHHFGVLNDNKIDKLRSLGLLSDPKKSLSTDLKLASVKAYLLDILVDLKESFSPNTKLFQAYLFGLSTKGLSMLAHLLQKLTSLETFILQLKIYSPDDFPQEGVATIGRSLRKFRKLKTLQLNFEGKYKVPKGGLESFGQDLGHLQNLRQLSLSFPKFEFTPQGIRSVFKVLGNLSRLEILSLNLADTECEKDKGVLELANSFEKLKNLHALSLNFGVSSHVPEDRFIHLVDNLASLTQLSYLDLIMNGCDLSSDFVIHLSRALTSLKKLQLLNVNLLGNEFISHEAHCMLWEGIGTLEELKSLEVKTGTTKNRDVLTNEGVSKLGMTIKNLLKLNKLALILRGSLALDDEGVLAFGDLVATAQELTDTEIYFMRCDILSKNAVELFREKLKSAPKMDKLTIKH